MDKILFYEDTDSVREFQDKFKTYEDKFPGWSEQTNGMHQYHSMLTLYDLPQHTARVLTCSSLDRTGG